MGRPKFYAVKIGREGPKIYTTWDQTSRWPGAVHKSFLTRTQAEKWLAESHPSGQSAVLRAVRALAPAIVEPERNGGPPPLKRPKLEAEAKTHAAPGGVTLSHEQKLVLDKVRDGKSVFFTGSAGTGKSLLLREIIKLVKDANYDDEYCLAITASTGIASVNIGGCTIHSWAGIGLGIESAKNLAGKFLHQPMFENVVKRWRRVKTLIIDEISMIDGSLFDKLEFIARTVRRSERPFGGIQLILSGDFAQLPPVPGVDKNGKPLPVVFAFQAESWEICVGKPVLLKKVFRQRDQTFVNMLNAMRFANLDRSTVEAFYSLSRPVHYDDGIEPTELYPTRSEVDQANLTRLTQLASPAHHFQALDLPGVNDKGERASEDRAKKLLERLVAPACLTIKVGAQVMLIKNLRQGELVNGSLGVVVAFCTENEARKWHTEVAGDQNNESAPVPQAKSADDEFAPIWPIVRFASGRKMLMTAQDFTILNAEGQVEASRHQVPLILAWALSMHKSQGQTLERVRVNLQRTFEKGQAYVALSRATKLESLQVLNFHPTKVVAHPVVVSWYKNLMEEDFADSQDWEYLDESDNLELDMSIRF